MANRLLGAKVLLAVSGGADSVAMLRLWVDVWQQSTDWDPSLLAVAHYNHKLRGSASDLDQQFVCDLARSLQLQCYTQSADQPLGITHTNHSSEAALRKARYGFLQATAARTGARCLMVAHTADDNVETMLHHLFRGSGTAGLAGIAPHRGLGEDLVLIRPLLMMWRDDLRNGLLEIGQPWREDHSNQDDRYQRNWIRSTLLPMIRQRYPLADKAVSRAIHSQARYHDWTQREALAWIDQNVTRSSLQLTLQHQDLELATLSAVVRLLWKQMRWPRQSFTAGHLRRLHAAICLADTKSFTLPGDVQCQVSPQQVRLQRGR